MKTVLMLADQVTCILVIANICVIIGDKTDS